MTNLIPPEGTTDAQIDAFIARLRREAREKVRAMLAAGAPEVEITEYLASLELEPDESVPAAGGVL